MALAEPISEEGFPRGNKTQTSQLTEGVAEGETSPYKHKTVTKSSITMADAGSYTCRGETPTRHAILSLLERFFSKRSGLKNCHGAPHNYNDNEQDDGCSPKIIAITLANCSTFLFL